MLLALYYEVGTVAIFILQVGKLRHWGFKSLAWGPRTSQWQSSGSTPGRWAWESKALTLHSTVLVGSHHTPVPAHSWAVTAWGAVLTQHSFFQFSTPCFTDESIFWVSFSGGGTKAQLSEQGIGEPASLGAHEVPGCWAITPWDFRMLRGHSGWKCYSEWSKLCVSPTGAWVLDTINLVPFPTPTLKTGNKTLSPTVSQ